MDTKTMLSTLEEELLYVLYDDYLLKKSIMKLDKLSVFFDRDCIDVSVLSYSLIIETDKEQKLILQSGNVESFIQTLQTYKRLEIEMDDWDFLDDSLRKLSEEMVRYEELIREKIESFYVSRFSSEFFIPLKCTINFKDEEESFFYSEHSLSHTWTIAWKRFAGQKRNYFSYLGFHGEQLHELLHMQILSISEKEVEIDKVGRVTKVCIEVEYNHEQLSLSYYTNKSLLTETHMFVDHSLDTYESWLNGKTLSDVFGIEKDHGYDLEKQIKQFLNRESVMYQDLLEKFKKQNHQSMIGLSVVSVYEKDGTEIYELSDGTKVRKI